MRIAGFNHIDVGRTGALGIVVAPVPAYSPYAVAEHALALLLALNRKLHRGDARVRTFAREALANIADTTIGNATAFATGQGELHRVG